MRKDNSEFVTEFITKAGSCKQNRDYFAYAELDDMVCWVLADGLDSEPEMLSAEIVAGSIINDFTENPSMKRRHIKKYIKNANQTLHHESRIMKLQSTVLVVVSDYSSIVWGSVGNTRLYHLRKERINLKSKDHSVAQMMVEAEEIKEQQLNQHQERNNLTQYLGQEERIKPRVSKKHKLKDDDVLLMCTSGFWENIDNKEIQTVLKDSTEAKEFVDNLENNMLNKDNNNLDNYSIASVFIKKAFKEKSSRKGLYKKIAAVLVPIIILSGSFFAYSKIKKAKRLEAAKMKKQKLRSKRSKNAVEKIKAGENLFKKGKYNKALTKYTKAKDLYKKNKEEEKLKAVKPKINDTKIIVAAKKIEKKGDSKFNKAKYQKALSKYKEAKLDYLKVKKYNLKEIEKKIAKTKDILQAINYEKEGNVFFKSKDFSVAKEKYSAALKIYREKELGQKEQQMKDKIRQTERLMKEAQKITKAQKFEAKADELFELEDFKNATLKYTEAKVIYSELAMSKKVNEIKDKIDNVAVAKSFNKAKEQEEVADVQLEKGKYEEALLKYKQADKIYSKIGKANATERIKKKIEENQKIIRAHKLKSEGNQFFKSDDFENATSKYTKAKGIYSELKMSQEVKEIKDKLNKITVTETYNKAKDHEKLGDKQLKNEKYDKALFNYKKAKKTYSKINKSKKVKEIEQKIKETKKKKEKFLFFF